jgi:hypothetical protein
MWLTNLNRITLSNIMLEGNQKFNGQNFNAWKQPMLAIFEYRCLDRLVLGKEMQSQTNVICSDVVAL